MECQARCHHTEHLAGEVIKHLFYIRSILCRALNAHLEVRNVNTSGIFFCLFPRNSWRRFLKPQSQSMRGTLSVLYYSRLEGRSG
ncbi:hypothetical protein Pelo_576 [Pelomyxa schiedti]|nr:hypothetical protein Pelo_576 [Pelomyxa schiedti]